MTNLMTAGTQSSLARNINSQSRAKRSARLSHRSNPRFPKPHIPAACLLPGRTLFFPCDYFNRDNCWCHVNSNITAIFHNYSYILRLKLNSFMYLGTNKFQTNISQNPECWRWGLSGKKMTKAVELWTTSMSGITDQKGERNTGQTSSLVK